MNIHRVCSVNDPAYHELLRIYRDSQPESELKGSDDLARMIERPEYFFLAGRRDESIVGYAICICLPGSDAALLEYMAVTRELRGLGLGQELFKQTAALGPIANRTLLIEVDSDRLPSPDHADQVRRKKFYRRLGCREIDGLAYIMPPVSSAPPPAMDMLVYAVELPGTLRKSRIRGWLQSCYQQVYDVPENDPRIEVMVARLPENVRLI